MSVAADFGSHSSSYMIIVGHKPEINLDGLTVKQCDSLKSPQNIFFSLSNHKAVFSFAHTCLTLPTSAVRGSKAAGNFLNTARCRADRERQLCRACWCR